MVAIQHFWRMMCPNTIQLSLTGPARQTSKPERKIDRVATAQSMPRQCQMRVNISNIPFKHPVLSMLKSLLQPVIFTSHVYASTISTTPFRTEFLSNFHNLVG